MKRKWLMVPLVTGLLAAGLTGASVLAHNEDGENETPKETVAAKVAEILGIEDEQTVKDALQTATKEVRLDRLQHRLDDMVEAGTLTQDQADEYLTWYESRPEGPNLHRNGHRMFGFGGGGEGDENGPRQSFGRRSGGGEFSGFGQRPEGSDSSDVRQLPNGRDFTGRGNLRSRFGQRFNGQHLSPGLGSEVPSEAPAEVPQGSGTSF